MVKDVLAAHEQTNARKGGSVSICSPCHEEGLERPASATKPPRPESVLGRMAQHLSPSIAARPRLRHDLRPEPTGWTVYDTTNGQPVCLDGTALIDLAFEEADGLAPPPHAQEGREPGHGRTGSPPQLAGARNPGRSTPAGPGGRAARPGPVHDASRAGGRSCSRLRIPPARLRPRPASRGLSQPSRCSPGR